MWPTEPIICLKTVIIKNHKIIIIYYYWLISKIIVFYNTKIYLRGDTIGVGGDKGLDFEGVQKDKLVCAV